MSKVQMLRALVKQRLTAAAEEIFGLFERTIAEYEEELCRSKEENHRQRHLLDAVFNPKDVQQLSVAEEQFSAEQQDWDQDNHEDSPLKEEQAELRISQKGEQLQELEEIKFTVTHVEDEEKPQSSQLHQIQTEASGSTEHMKTESPGAEPDTQSGPQTDDKDLNHCGNQCRDSCLLFYKSATQAEVPSNKKEISRGEKPFSCSECGKTFKNKSNLNQHIKIHKGEKPFQCSLCGKTFIHRSYLRYHMRCHTGEKPFSCSVCKKHFRTSGHVVTHMRVHTGERPYVCPICNKSFIQKVHLAGHMDAHMGQNTVRCSACGKRYSKKSNLERHKCGRD